MTNPLKIVDSHVHLWNPAHLQYAWLKELPALNRSFLPGDYSAASANTHVSKFIFVESGCEPSQSLAEVEWISGLAKFETRLKGVIAHAALEKGGAARPDLEKLATHPLVKGVRRNLQGERSLDFCLQPGFIAGIKLLAHFNFTFDVCIRHDQLPAVTELARRVPEVTFILDHFGKPMVRNKSLQPWATDLEALAALPNVACKISGLATEADWKNWRPSDLKPYFDRALECFGFDRLLFGSDWPVATRATNYQRWFETTQELLALANESDRVKLFQTNAERIYRV